MMSRSSAAASSAPKRYGFSDCWCSRRQVPASNFASKAARLETTRSTPSACQDAGRARAARERHRAQRRRVFLPGRVNPVVLRRNSNALFCCSGCATGAPIRDYHPGRSRQGAPALDPQRPASAERRRRLRAPSSASSGCAPHGRIGAVARISSVPPRRSPGARPLGGQPAGS